MQEDFAAVQRIDALPSTSASSSLKQASAAPTAAARTYSSAKLEPFLLLAKSARGGAAAALIDQATAAPGVFVFAELTETKAVAELAGNEQYRNKWDLLQVFAYGNLPDYRANASSLPALSEAQLTKLKMLTLVDLASRSRSLPYSELLQALEMSSTRALEDLLIEAIYSDLLVGKINQKQQVLEVDSVVGRDVRPVSSSSGGAKSIEGMMAALGDWYAQVGETLANLDYHIEALRKKEAADASSDRKIADNVSKTLAEIAKSAEAKGGPGGGGGRGFSGAGEWQMNGGGGGGHQAVYAHDDVVMETEGAKRSPTKPATRKRLRP